MDRLEAAGEEIRLVTKRDDDAHSRRRPDRAPYPERARHVPVLDGRVFASSNERVGNGRTCARRRAGRRPIRELLRTALAEDLWQMSHAARTLGRTQRQIVELRTVEAGAKPLQLFDEAAPDGEKAADVGLREQEIR